MSEQVKPNPIEQSFNLVVKQLPLEKDAGDIDEFFKKPKINRAMGIMISSQAFKGRDGREMIQQILDGNPGLSIVHVTMMVFNLVENASYYDPDSLNAKIFAATKHIKFFDLLTNAAKIP